MFKAKKKLKISEGKKIKMSFNQFYSFTLNFICKFKK